MTETAQKKEQNTLVWSFSRYQSFKSCKKKYFWDRYPDYDGTISPEKLKELKKMESFHLVLGKVVHETIRQILTGVKEGSDVPGSEKIKEIIKGATKPYEDKTFIETELKGWNEINFCVLQFNALQLSANLLKSTLFSGLIMACTPEEKKKWMIEHNSGIVEVNNNPLYLIPDFVFQKGDTLYVLDWKTGRPREDVKNQLVSYTLHPEVAANFPDHKQLSAIPVYLKDMGQTKEFTVDDTKRGLRQQEIEDEIEEMKTFCQDTEKDIPLDKKYFFSYKDGDQEKFCSSCCYQTICDELKK